MKKLLSLPPNLVECFHEITGNMQPEWYCTSDPVDAKLGSGGGTVWLLKECWRNDTAIGGQCGEDGFEEWLSREKRILLHAGGQSRRLPSYAPSGKILTPVPVFRWKRGQRLTQTLLDLQLPLYNQIMEAAPESLHTMVVSGDVLIRCTRPLAPIPEADVVCYGLWAEPQLAMNHGVFAVKRTDGKRLDFMLQKPSLETIASLVGSHLLLMDIGIWMLSDRAVALMEKRAMEARGARENGTPGFYDMYSEFGLALGDNPKTSDDELNSLSVAIIPLDGGEFYHYGTSRELLSSTLSVQRLVTDQREIMHHKIKPHPAIFIQNATVEKKLNGGNSEIWIENSHVGEGWNLSDRNIITGVPRNDWRMDVESGICIDVVPIGENDYVARPYGFNDAMKGSVSDSNTLYQGKPVTQWLSERGLSADDLDNSSDLQAAPLFPLTDDIESLGTMIRFMTSEPNLEDGRRLWKEARRISANEISATACMSRLIAQRKDFVRTSLPALASHHRRSIFYQLDLGHTASLYSSLGINAPEELPSDTDASTQMTDCMFRSRLSSMQGKADEAQMWQDKAFGVMQKRLLLSAEDAKQTPRCNAHSDQIVWGRSPVRIDIAGGWTDTPPFCLQEGGNVLNIAIELNGQPPLQVYVKPCKDYHIVLRSIDLSASETVETYDELKDFNKVGSPFSIPKAAVALAGFLPQFSSTPYPSLRTQLEDFGCGIEITLLSAIPSGSGLGTSSILAATVLGSLNDFCDLRWDKHEICSRSLLLEQMLTTGGGWQDQYGGVFGGVKLLQTQGGWTQQPLVRSMSDTLFTDIDYKNCHLLYYTGIRRTAKNILAEIVQRMFLNDSDQLQLLSQMKQHAINLADTIQCNSFEKLGLAIRKTWKQNSMLDKGCNPPEIQRLTSLIDDLCLGYKLPGAGGGGYLYMVAKDEEAAMRIRQILNDNRMNDRARFVDMTLSRRGLEISRS